MIRARAITNLGWVRRELLLEYAPAVVERAPMPEAVEAELARRGFTAAQAAAPHPRMLREVQVVVDGTVLTAHEPATWRDRVAEEITGTEPDLRAAPPWLVAVVADLDRAIEHLQEAERA